MSKTSTFEHLYRVKQLLVTVGDDKEGDTNKTITDLIILGTLLILSLSKSFKIDSFIAFKGIFITLLLFHVDVIPDLEDSTMVTRYLDLNDIDISTDEHVFLDFQINSRKSVAIEVDITFVSKRVDQGVAYGMVVLILM